MYSTLTPRKEVLRKFFAAWSVPYNTEIIPTEQGYGRVLARDTEAMCDKPVLRASKMDGIGISAAVLNAGADTTKWRPGVDYCRADTGDDFPDEYDAVIQIEDVTILPDGGVVLSEKLKRPVEPGFNVAPQGSFIRKGTIVGKRGSKLTADRLGALCIGAVDKIEVFRKPRCAFIPTGSELVPLGTVPARGQSVDSNSIMAKAMLEEMGAEVVLFPITPDNRGALENALNKALEICDAVVINAGTSKGNEDYCYEFLQRGLIAHGVAAYPGKPLALAVLDGKPVINVAGPPTACFNGMDWCVRPIIGAYSEQTVPVRRTVTAVLAERIDGNGGPDMEAIVRINLEKTDSGYLAHPISHSNRHATQALLADGLYITKLPPEPTEKGDTITVEVLH